MVAQATSSEQTQSGLRLIHSSRDIVAVSRLVERAFAEDMDASGRRAMREMRWLGTLFGWLDMFGMPGQGMLPGFVWVEDGVIVGNATVRRLGSFGHGWMIGNVAVDPAWRRRGIARQLMQASLDLAREHDADWIALQVRSDNAAAHDLYKSLGFEDTGETVYFERVQFDPIEPPGQPVEGRMRPATNADIDRIFTLAQSTVPDSARWAEPIYRSSFDVSAERRLVNWLTHTRQVWRVIEGGDQLWGAAMAEANTWTHRGQLQVWVTPARAGRIEQLLVDAVLSELTMPLQTMTARLPGQHVAGRVALSMRGFQPVRALTNMRLQFQRPQSV